MSEVRGCKVRTVCKCLFYYRGDRALCFSAVFRLSSAGRQTNVGTGKAMQSVCVSALSSSSSVWASDRTASLGPSSPSAWLHLRIPLCSSRWSIRSVSQAGIGVHASPHTFACVVVRSHACILRLCACTYGCAPFSPVDFAIPSQATVWPASRPAGYHLLKGPALPVMQLNWMRDLPPR